MNSTFLKVAEVTKHFQISRSSLYDLVRKGKFPAPLKLGRSSRWTQEQIAAFVAQQNGGAQ